MSDRPVFLRFGGTGEIPKEVATCPECDGQLTAHCTEWDSESGVPRSLELECEKDFCPVRNEDGFEHRCYQSDWQPTVDRVNKWAGVEQ